MTRHDLRQPSFFLCALLPVWLAAGRPVAAVPVVAQTGPAAACKECQDLADKIRQLEETQRSVRERIRETAARVAQLRAELSVAQADLARVSAAPPSGERASQIQQLERRISRMQSEIKDQFAYAEKLEAQQSSLRADFLVLSVELEACNRRCERKASSSTQPTGTGFQPGTGVPTPPAPVTKCPECRAAADRLKELQDQRLDLAERLETYRTRLASIEAETDKLLAELKELEALSRGRGLTSAEEARSQQIMQRVDDLGATLFGPATKLILIESELERELGKLDDEITRAAAELKACNERCGTKETGSIFTKPQGYGALAGAVAIGGVLLGTGGDSPSTSSTAMTPVAAPSPTTGTTAPTTPEPPTTAVATTHNVVRCVCTDDSAQRDAVLRFCQLVTQLLARFNGTVLEMVGPSPFGTMQGTLNATTGAIDLMAMTSAGPLEFTATVDAARNFTNALATFGTGTMRTVYRFDMVQVQ